MITRNDLDQICYELDNGITPKQAYALLVEVQKRLEVKCFRIKESNEYHSAVWLKTANSLGHEIAEKLTDLPLVG
jgi:hypothetical protein